MCRELVQLRRNAAGPKPRSQPTVAEGRSALRRGRACRSVGAPSRGSSGAANPTAARSHCELNGNGHSTGTAEQVLSGFENSVHALRGNLAFEERIAHEGDADPPGVP